MRENAIGTRGKRKRALFLCSRARAFTLPFFFSFQRLLPYKLVEFCIKIFNDSFQFKLLFPAQGYQNSLAKNLKAIKVN